MTVLLPVIAVSSALIIGAVWGGYGPLPPRLRGFLLAFSAGSLITALTFELVDPARVSVGIWTAGSWLFAGAVVFTAVDHVVDEVWTARGGLGVVAATTFDGIPENLALGASLVGGGGAVGALTVAIFVSNLPEAAAGTVGLVRQQWQPRSAVILWSLTALALALAAVAGNLLLRGADEALLAPIRSFAAGAVISSLATELLPEAFSDARELTGIAIAAGFLLTLAVQ